MTAGIDREDLRALVRQALKESFATGEAPAVAVGLPERLRAALAKGKPAKLSVVLASSEDIGGFAKGVAEACEDSDLKAAIVGGDIRFELARAASTLTDKAVAGTQPVAKKTGAFEVSSGVLSEVRIVEISRTHSKIVVGKDVVLTPLARDKAREIKIELVRQKP